VAWKWYLGSQGANPNLAFFLGLLLVVHTTGQNYAIWDKDGSLIGGKGGYVVGRTPF